VNIKNIKVGNLIYSNFWYSAVIDGEVSYNLTQDVEEFRGIALDTLKWRIGNKIKKEVGSSKDLSVANSKAVVLLAKLLKDSDTSELTGSEKEVFDGMVSLSDRGYADSELLKKTVETIDVELDNSIEDISSVVSADSIDEMISILNK